MAKISIIIPVFNTEKYISHCLNSVINQTFKDLEIICVLDGSTDSSADICKKFASRDNRIKIIDHKTNRGLLIARKTGVLASTGEYIMFLDSDDWLEIRTCSYLYDCIKANNVDILQFGTYVNAEPDVSPQRVANVRNLLLPYIGKLLGKEVFEGAFRYRKFRFSIWNKIYRASLCKEVFKNFDDYENIFKAEDLCAFFRLAYLAKSYMGIEEKFYHYRFGAGLTGRSSIDLNAFETYCKQSIVPEKCRTFLIDQGAFEEYKDIYESIKKDLLNECINAWFSYLSLSDSAAGFKCLVKYWNVVDVAIALSQRWYYESVIMLSDRIYSPDLLKYTPRKIRKIALYYHRYSIGGVQKVISLLISILLEQGYDLLLITDEEASETDCYLPDTVKRIVVPASNKPSEYPCHAIKMHDVLVENNIDLVIYNATSSQNLLFDILVVKSLGLPIVLYIHEYFGVGYSRHETLPIRKIKVFRFADKAVALSRVQRDYWLAVGSNAVYIPNPLDKKALSVKKSSLDNHNILWVGRLSKQKGHLDALEILAKVVKAIPDAQMIFAGNFFTNSDEQEFYKKIDEYNIKDHVKLLGYVNDVYPLYENSSLFLSTSEAESFCMALAESKAAGLPCVMYSMPYLEFQQDSRGIKQVPMHDTTAAAEAIINIFSNKELLHRLSSEALESIKPFLSHDYGKSWKNLIQDLENQPGSNKPIDNSSKEIIINTLVGEYLKCVTEYRMLKKKLQQSTPSNNVASNEKLRELQKQLEKAKKANDALLSSNSYKIGRFITWIPRKLKGIVVRLTNNGFKNFSHSAIDYLIKQFKDKPHNQLLKKNTQNEVRPIVTIILPFNEYDQSLSKTIASLLEQTFSNFELICVEYGFIKKENTSQYDYLKFDSRIRLFNIISDQPSFARNVGIKAARGDYILFAEPAIYYNTVMLEKVVKASQKANADITIFDKNCNFSIKRTFRGSHLNDNLFASNLLKMESMLFSAKFISYCDILFPPFKDREKTAFLLSTIPLANRITIIKQDLLYSGREINHYHGTNRYVLPATSILDADIFIKSRLVRTKFSKIMNKHVYKNTIAMLSSDMPSKQKQLLLGYIYDSFSYRFNFNNKLRDIASEFKYDYKPNSVNSENQVYVSVIIPVFNSETYLRPCLDSVLKQTLENIEIICVDDGSTDNSLNILKEFEKLDSRVKVFTQTNSGAGTARNLGMKHASGNYIVFLDSDDFFEPVFLELLYRQCLKDSADIGVCAADKYNVEKKLFEPLPSLLMKSFLPSKIPFSRKDIPDTILLFTTTSPWNKMFKRSFINSLHIIFQDNIRSNDGYFVMSALARAERITIVEKPLVHYRVGMSSNLQSNNYKTPTSFCRTLQCIKMELEIDGLFGELKRSFANMALNNSMYNWDTLANHHNEQKLLASELCSYYFDEFGITGHSEEYFFNKGYYKKYKKIVDDYQKSIINKL